jgi:hypothetical protein
MEGQFTVSVQSITFEQIFPYAGTVALIVMHDNSRGDWICGHVTVVHQLDVSHEASASPK